MAKCTGLTKLVLNNNSIKDATALAPLMQLKAVRTLSLSHTHMHTHTHAHTLSFCLSIYLSLSLSSLPPTSPLSMSLLKRCEKLANQNQHANSKMWDRDGGICVEYSCFFVFVFLKNNYNSYDRSNSGTVQSRHWTTTVAQYLTR